MRKIVVFCVLFLIVLMIPVVTARNKNPLVPLKLHSPIVLDYEFLDLNLTAVVDIEFSGFICEYNKADRSLFYLLLGVSGGYRSVRFCNITLVIGDFNVTQSATFAQTVKGCSGEREVYVTMMSRFFVSQSMVILDVVNGTLGFQASYNFEISGSVFGYTMTDGVAVVKIGGVQYQPDEEVPDETPDETPDGDEEISDVPDNNIQIISILAIVCLVIGFSGFFLAKRRNRSSWFHHVTCL